MRCSRLSLLQKQVSFLALNLALALLLLGLVSPVSAQMGSALRRSPVFAHQKTQEQHSLQPPLDNMQVYWNFGSSTVLTDKFIRLTPATQDRRGWLWNEYPIEADDFQVEMEFKIHSRPHFGGDGMALWLLHGDFDPAFSQQPNSLQGGLFGMRTDFRGVGIILDVYDNDGRRDNPRVFVLANEEKVPEESSGAGRTFNHDGDFEGDMLDTVTFRNNGKPHEKSCVMQVRNLPQPARLLATFREGVLSVFLGVSGSEAVMRNGVLLHDDWKLCLQVNLPNKSYRDYHLAFSAATGQVSDQHDLLKLTTRYLDDLPQKSGFFAETFEEWSSSESLGTLASLLSMFVMFGGMVVVSAAGFELHSLNQAVRRNTNPVQVCQSLNAFLKPSWLVHLALTAVLLLSARWIVFLINLPLAGWRAFLLSKGRWAYMPQHVSEFGSGMLKSAYAGAASSSGSGGAGPAGFAPGPSRSKSGLSRLSARHRLALVVVLLGLLELAYVHHFFTM